jgi:hypothetical protein
VGQDFVPARGLTSHARAGRLPLCWRWWSLMVDARFLALAVPIEYRYKSGARDAREPSYAKTYSVVEAIYGSQRLELPFARLLLIGD